MTYDIVVPNGNEQEFADMAKKLGYTELIYAYEKRPKEVKVSIPYRIATFGKEGLRIGQKAQDLESGKTAFLVNLELEPSKDRHHHRSSGFNQAYAALAKKQKTIICFNLQLLTQEPEKILGRMMQNAVICRKYKLPVLIVSFARDPYEMRSPKDLQAMGRVLGIPLFK